MKAWLLRCGQGVLAGLKGRSAYLAFWVALSTTVLFILMKLQLFLWYTNNGVNPFSSTPQASLPFVFGADVLVAGVFFCLAYCLYAFGKLLPRGELISIVAISIIYWIIAIVSIVGLKFNQLYNVPLDVSHIRALGDVSRAADSLWSVLDLQVLLGIFGAIACYSLFLMRARKGMGGGGGRPRSLFFYAAVSLIYVYLTAPTLAGVYTFGVKKNTLMNLAMSLAKGNKHVDADSLLTWYQVQRSDRAEGRDFVESLRKQDQQAGLGLPKAMLQGSNVLFLLLESTSRFHLNETTMPVVYGLQQKSVELGFHLTSSSASKEAVYSLLYSDYLSHDLRGAMRTLHSGDIKFDSFITALDQLGYDTAVFQSGYLGYTDFKHLWEGKGVDTLVGAEDVLAAEEDRLSWSWGAFEEDVVTELTSWLNNQVETGNPFFLMYRPVFPHHPYHSNSPTKIASVDSNKGRHSNALFYVDSQVGQIIRALTLQGRMEDTLILVVADHGETVTDKAAGHGLRISGEELVVPMFFVHPKLYQHLQRYEGLTNHLDVAPTLASLLGAATYAGWLGRDLTLERVSQMYALLPVNHARQVGKVGSDFVCVRNLGSGYVNFYKAAALQENVWPLEAMNPGEFGAGCANNLEQLNEDLLYHHLNRLLQE